MSYHPPRSYNLHPYRVFLVILLTSLTMLFLGFTTAYLYTCYTKSIDPIRLPPIFILNTFILLISSYFMHRANAFYRSDETPRYQIALAITLFLTVLFVILQAFGWSQLRSRGLFVSSYPGSSYLYAISGLHYLHVLGGIPFLILFLQTSIKRMREPLSVLIYFADPEKKLKLQLLTLYWHFLDVLWIYLVLFFLGTHLFFG